MHYLCKYDEWRAKEILMLISHQFIKHADSWRQQAKLNTDFPWTFSHSTVQEKAQN